MPADQGVSVCSVYFWTIICSENCTSVPRTVDLRGRMAVGTTNEFRTDFSFGLSCGTLSFAVLENVVIEMLNQLHCLA